MAKFLKNAAPAVFNILKSVGTKQTGYVSGVDGPFRCGSCNYFDPDGFCGQKDVNADPDTPKDKQDRVVVSPADCCNEFEPSTAKEKSMKGTLKKFIPFVKVDETKRQVWGIVTAELPDKEDEVCDYTKSKPFYKAVIDEMSKSTGGENFFPLREMHQLSAVGKCIGFEFRDDEKEIVMGFEVVDDDAWKKVQKRVYTGFSQGGRIVGDLTPDPIFKGCMRYTADPTEVSLVDNPCLGAAHFAHVKADNTVEICKLRSAPLETIAKETPGVVKARAIKREALVKAEGRRFARIWVNKNAKKIAQTKKSTRAKLKALDDDLGKLKKGMTEISCLAYLLNELTYCFYRVCNEQEWEGDNESKLPEMLSTNLNQLVDALLEMVAEETKELQEDVAARLAGTEAATAS